MLSVGGIRHQFTLPENVQMSMYMYEFLRDVKEHLSVLGKSTLLFFEGLSPLILGKTITQFLPYL